MVTIFGFFVVFQRGFSSSPLTYIAQVRQKTFLGLASDALKVFIIGIPLTLIDRNGSMSIECQYHAPYFAVEIGVNTKRYRVMQGCCNHWDCPRCGKIRATEEYWKIINGANILDKDFPLYFLTLTCRGKELTLKEAEDGYLEWTNRFMDAARLDAKRNECHWCYVQVTERQKRGHPHSHILTTWRPSDGRDGVKWRNKKVDGEWKRVSYDVVYSEWTKAQCIRSGLGEQYEISKVKNADAVTRYIGKYLFKKAALTEWPPRWKRVRYSHGWPKTPDPLSNAIPLVRAGDWLRLCVDAREIRYNGTKSEVAHVARRLIGFNGKYIFNTDANGDPIPKWDKERGQWVTEGLT